MLNDKRQSESSAACDCACAPGQLIVDHCRLLGEGEGEGEGGGESRWRELDGAIT